MRCATCGKDVALSPVSLTPEIHENLCAGCKVDWTVYARHMGCPKQPALSLMYFRQWQSGRERRAA